MKLSRVAASTICAIAVFCLMALSSSAQAQKPEEVFVVKDGDWVVKKTGEEPDGPRGAGLEEGMWWMVVGPEFQEQAKNLAPGLLLFDKNAPAGKQYSFLPLKEDQLAVESVSFSPTRTRMVVALKVNRALSDLYVYDVKTLKLEHSFLGYSDIWFVDDVRFVFTAFDQKIERPFDAGMFGTCAAIYEPAEKQGYVILKAATAKENFAVMGLADGKIEVTVTTVKSEKDWEDFDKQQESTIVVEVPAAG
jgi:hypothetical protein